MDEMTVGDLLRQLQGCDPNDRLLFDGGVTFNRLKRRGPDLMVLEFNEIQADLSPAFRKRHPNVLVAFAAFHTTGEMVQMVSVPRL